MTLKEYFEPIAHAPVQWIYAFLAIFGGCARYFNSFVVGKPFKMSYFLASAFSAGFSGYMFALMGDSMSLPYPLPHIMAGVGGFFGEQTMKLLMEYFTQKTVGLEAKQE